MRRLLLIGTLMLTAAPPAPGATPAAQLTHNIQEAHWIWLKGYEDTPQTTIYFRKTFALASKPVEAAVRITCDNAYKLWINGTFSAETSNPGPDAWKTADNYDVAQLLHEGENYVAVEGINDEGKGALLAQIAVRTADGNLHSVSTDSSWEASAEPGQNWQQSASEGGNWQAVLDYGPALTTAPWYYPGRPSALESLISETKVELHSAAVSPVSVKLDPSTTARVTGFAESGENAAAATVDVSEPGQKAVFVCDFGRQIVGYPVLMGNAYSNTKISVACGEYEAECDAPFQAVITRELRPGGVRWCAFDRRAFRYLKFTIEPSRAIKIDRLQAQVVEYPVEEAGTFECSDDLLNKIWDTSRHTLRLCMQDFYEDGVKRDRLLWVGDFRIEALVNYYVFGDTALAKRSLMQMANLQLPDGMIPAAGPYATGHYLPDYCAYYVISLADYYRYTADKDTVQTLYPYVQKLMEWFHSNCDESGMFRHADREGWWIFVDWDESLEKQDRVTALEALYYWALNDAMELAKALGEKRDHGVYSGRAALLKKSANAALWLEGKGAYIDCVSDQGASTLIHKQPNALALLAGLPDTEMAAKVLDAIAAAGTPPVTTPYMNFYVASALFEQGRTQDAIELIRSYWGGMIERGATTFWEKFDPRWPVPYEDKDMSYCHGWSSGPAQMLPAYIAGVRPMLPGFEQVLIAPELSGLGWVKSDVPSPKGTIKVDWKRMGLPTGTLTLPRGCTGYIMLPQPPEGASYTVNGRPVGYKIESGKAVFKLRGAATYELGYVSVGTPPVPPVSQRSAQGTK